MSPRQYRVAAASIAAASLGCLVSGVSPATAAAAPTTAKPDSKSHLAPRPTGQLAAFLAAQDKVDSMATDLEAAVAGDPNYAGVVVAAATKTISLYWHGPVSQPVHDAIERAHQRGLLLQVFPALYTHAQLDGARQRLLRCAGIVTLAVAPDGSGLDIGVDPTAAPASARALSASSLTSTVGVPVRTHQQGRFEPASRWADTLPFYGGGGVYEFNVLNGGRAECSTGFGVHDASRSSPHYYMLTADHCRQTSTAYTTPGGTSVGPPYEWESDFDQMILDTSHGRATYGVSSGNRVYAGGTDTSGGGAGETTRVVSGYYKVQNGDLTCTSGGFSGELCNIKVSNNDEAVTVGGLSYIHMIDSWNPAHTNAAGEGDSGGPSTRRIRTARWLPRG